MGSRQAGILMREVLDLKRSQNAEEWPCFIAGGNLILSSSPLLIIYHL